MKRHDARLGNRPVRATFSHQGCRHRTRQQDRQNGLGHDGQGRVLQRTRRACDVNEIALDVQREGWGGRTARNAEPVDPAIGLVPVHHRIRAFDRPDPRRALWPAVMRTALIGRTHGCTDQRRDVKFALANWEPSTHRT